MPTPISSVSTGGLSPQVGVNPCTARDYADQSHWYPGDTAVVGYSAGNGNLGVQTVTVQSNPIPHSSAYFTPNPLTTQNGYRGYFKIALSTAAPPGDYQAVYTIKITATARPSTTTWYNCIVIATPPGVIITSVGVGNAPVVIVAASPTATSGKYTIYLRGDAVTTTPTPLDEPAISSNVQSLVYLSTGWDTGGNRTFLFTFMQNTPLPSGQPTPIAPGRYATMSAKWANYGSLNDPKVAPTETPMVCYNLSNDVVNQSLINKAATMSLVVQLQASPNPVKPIVFYNNTPDPRLPGVDGLAYWSLTNYPEDALVYYWSGAIKDAGHDPDQVIYHELDHFYYGGPTNGVFPPQLCKGQIACAAEFTVNLGGKPTTFLWNFIPVNGTASNGYNDFIHLLIHNDLVAAFKTDKTGSLNQAFDQTNPTPSPPAGVYPVPNASQWSQIQSSYTSNSVPWSWATPTPSSGFTPSPLPSPTPTPVPPPPTGLTCANVPHASLLSPRTRNPNLVKPLIRPDPAQ